MSSSSSTGTRKKNYKLRNTPYHFLGSSSGLFCFANRPPICNKPPFDTSFPACTTNIIQSIGGNIKVNMRGSSSAGPSQHKTDSSGIREKKSRGWQQKGRLAPSREARRIGGKKFRRLFFARSAARPRDHPRWFIRCSVWPTKSVTTRGKLMSNCLSAECKSLFFTMAFGGLPAS